MELKTERLLIRSYRKEDIQDFYEIFSNPVVMEQCEPPYSMETCVKWLNYFINNPIAYAVEHTLTGKVIGHALFKQLPSEEEGIYEIGWIYNEQFWGQGYAYEASKALIDYGFEVLHLHKITAETIDPIKSVRLMKKLGMHKEAVLRRQTKDLSGSWVDLYWYGILIWESREKCNSEFVYKAASTEELEVVWDKEIAEHMGNDQWITWKAEYIEDNKSGKCKTFVILCDNHPVGQGTLLFSSECNGIGGRMELADGQNIANVNALRIDKKYEGQGHISNLIKVMEGYAAKEGYKRLTIGVEAKEVRNHSIYLHWGYHLFVKSEIEGGSVVLYYSKLLD